MVAFRADLLSGAVPEGDEGFESLSALGIKTIVTVDGTVPDVERARRFGMRYVHIPVTYAGLTSEQILAIARAVRDLPRPLYLHCHHGKHRSATAAGAAAITLGWMSPEDATAKMKVAGTSPQYPGLYRCVSAATVASALALDAADATFPEQSKPADFVAAMIEIDAAFDNLKAAETAGWQPPKDHPDLSPAAEAGRLVDLYRQAHDQPPTKLAGGGTPAELSAWLSEAQKAATELETSLTSKANGKQNSERLKAVATSCATCHAKYRNQH